MTEIQKLLDIMARLRDPKRGCPWDLAQNFSSIAPYTIEEAYEVADAIERGEAGELRDELGDLLLQVVFHAQMASEQEEFDFESVCRSINDKMIRRHPHVFGSESIDTPEEMRARWEDLKATERAARDPVGTTPSVLDGVPLALPALTRAVKLSRRATRLGFEWPGVDGVRDKVDEELAEVDALLAADGPPDREALKEELGDVLFALANLCRHLDVDPEAALRATNEKFRRRFTYVERQVGGTSRPLEELERHWQEAKAREREG